jgi:hypothetical protein
MKTFTIAVAMLALIAAPAYAQVGGKGGGGSATDESKSRSDARQKKADEKAYNAALQKIPDSKEKYDPWGVARPAEPAKDTAKKPKQVSQ